MGFSPMGGASSYGQSKEDFDNSIGRDRHDNRSDKDRREREDSYSSREKEEKERRERLERAKKEREAREKAERKAEAKAQKEAEEAAAAETEFGHVGQLSNPVMGQGVLAGMSLSSPTQAQSNMGVTNDVYDSLPRGTKLTDELMAESITAADDSVNRDIGYGAAASIANSVTGGLGGKVVEVAKEVLEDDTNEEKAWSDNLTASLAPNIYEANYNEAVAKDTLTDAFKNEMSNNGIVKNIVGAGQAANTISMLNGSKTAASLGPVFSNPVTSVVTNVIDPIIGRERWENANKDELDRLGIDLSSPGTSTNHDSDGGPSFNKGVLSNMASNPSGNLVQNSIAQQRLPDFSWVGGERFNTDYGMRFKR